MRRDLSMNPADDRLDRFTDGGATIASARGRRKMRKERDFGWGRVPRNRVLCPRVVVSGGGGYPVAVELEEIVGCCD
jgi:hypothetical protein